MIKRNSALIGLLVTGMALGSGAALGNQEDRRAAMKAIGGAAKALSQGKDAAANATIVAEKAAMIPVLFEANEITGDSTALPVIWEQFDDFSAKGTELEQAALAVLAAAEGGGDVAAAAKAMGATCGGCHKTYREKK